MIRNILFALVLICTTLPVYSQKFQVKWGPEYKKEGGMFSADFLLGSDDKYFYVLSDPRGKANLLKFDFTCKLVSTSPVSFETGKTKATVSGLLRMGKKNYIILVARDKKADVINYYYTELVNGKINAGIKNFYAVPFKFNFGAALSAAYGFSSVDASDASDFERSPSGNYAAILGTQITSNKDEIVKVSVLDDQLKISWEKTFPLPVSDRNIYIEQFIVNDKGEVYLSAKQWDSKESYKKGIPKYKYKVYKFTEGGMKETDITLNGDKAPWDAGLFPAPEGGVYLGGFFTKTSTPKGSADGVFFSRVDEAGKVKSNAYDFTKEFLEGLQTKKQEKKDQGITSFAIDYLVRLPDGSFSFIAEKFYVTTVTTTSSNGSTQTTYIYHSNEIVIPRFSAEGELISMAKIDKTFSAKNSSITTSYSFFIKDNSVVLVYNDFKTREERKEAGKGRAIYTDISYVDPSGKVVTDNIFTSKDVEKYYIPGASLDLGNGKSIVKAIKGKTYVYGIITP